MFEPFLQSSIGQFLTNQNIGLLAPELIILVTLLFSIIQSFSQSENERSNTAWLAILGIMFALVCMLLHFFSIYLPNVAQGRLEWLNCSVFSGMFRADLFSFFIRFFLLMGTLIVVGLSRQSIENRSVVPGEYYVLILGALLGSMLLSGATDLIMLFVALETLGISSYILAGYLRGDMKSSEASLKYLLFGGVSTAVTLFGFSFLYGLSGSTNYTEIAHALQPALASFHPMLPVMAVLILAGFCFKLSAAPFHMWAPDVYEGAPTPVTAFLSVVSKMAAFAMTIRLVYVVMGHMAGWGMILTVVAVLSMLMGNMAALSQRNVKRMLAYSTVAHAGYMLLGLVTMTPSSIAGMIYYLITYLFMNLGAFAAVVYLENQLGSNDVQSYSGLVQKRPLLVLGFSVCLLSLAGIPITSGFFAKFFLFQAVAAAGSHYLPLIILALLASTISLYYYLNVIRLMVIGEPSAVVAELPAKDIVSNQRVSSLRVALLLSVIGTLVLGIFANPFLLLSQESAKQLAWEVVAGSSVANLPHHQP